MAKVAGGLLVKLVLVVSVVVGLAGYAAAEGEGLPPASGGKVEVPDVQKNGEVQQMGRYCVTEYNKRMYATKSPRSGAKRLSRLSFSQVTKAEKQVVAGEKYYLTINAVDSDGGQMKTFEAELLLKPVQTTAKEMLAFSPAAAAATQN
ncbi:PREDICTED: cysteine proteinase inhibitor B-like isoform X2 [Ipomoea nil]|uniref:cysteine proteinase inhibitor B-like isoform X2 n=1 Tax=Ipomoea nil TaxID=35883 RepID=UPI0009016843|nr:PREDICTED: cysteine proteinase inhibitor B-like isoform X2 [Ipomoea nil]